MEDANLGLREFNIFIIIIVYFLIQTSYGDTLPFTLPSEFSSAEKSITEYPVGGSSQVSTNNNVYNYNQLFLEEVIFKKEVLPHTNFKKNEEIIIQIHAINNKLDPLENILIMDEIPWDLIESSIMLEKGPMISINKYNISIYKPQLNVNISIIENDSIPLNCSPDSATVVYLRGAHYLIAHIGKLNKSESINLKYKISLDQTKQYVLNPAKLYYKTFISGGSILESNPIYFNIIDSSPTIRNIEIKPNPAKLGNNDIVFKAIFEDNDSHDISKCELFSSIDGYLDTISNINNSDLKYDGPNLYNYEYKNKYRQLSEGIHTITFRVFDKDGEHTENSMTLSIDDYLLNIFPKKYLGWTFILALFFIIIDTILKDIYASNKKDLIRPFKANLIPMSLMILMFFLCFLLPIYFFSSLLN